MKPLVTVRCEKCGKWALKVAREEGRLMYDVAGQSMAVLVLKGEAKFQCRTFECRSWFSIHETDLSTWIEEAENTRPLTVFAKRGRPLLLRK